MTELYHVTQTSLFAYCKQCKNPFVPNDPHKAKFCSQKCYRASLKGRPLPANKNGIYKICEYCGKEYYASAKRAESQKFCGATCSNSAHTLPLIVIICAVCNKEFTPSQRRKQQLYCSRKCRSIHRKNGEIKRCEVCSVEVYIPACRLNAKNYFCSNKHANEWQGRNKIEYICKTCNKPFRKSASFEKFGQILYCTPQCAYEDPDRHTRLIKMNADQQQGKMTEPERIGYAILDEIGVEYLPQHLIANKFCVDAFVPSIGLVIQFDGDYWHFNPAKFQEPDERQRKRMRLDQSQDKYMKACGYAVLRIWESDLRSNPESVREAILHLLPPTAQ